MLKNWIATRGKYKNKQDAYVFVIRFPWSRWIKTKSPLKTLNHIGDLFYFTPMYLLNKGIINKLEMLQLLGLRKKYGRVKACLLELK